MISWIKLDINILDDAKIKIIRSHPNGDSVVLLWIGLLCLAMKSSRPGTIEIADGLPYTLDDLANQFNIEKKTVEMGIALFVKYRMIEVFQGGVIDILNFSKHQSLDKIEFVREQNRVRQRRHRKSKLLAITTGNCVYCGSKDNLEIDHIIPISQGGKGTDDNLVSACRDCNTSKNNHNILHFLNHILVDKADHKSINKNQNLMRIIRYDFNLSRYVTRDSVTVTPTDLDLDKDKDKEIPVTTLPVDNSEKSASLKNEKSEHPSPVPEEPNDGIKIAIREIQEKKGPRYAQQCLLFIQTNYRNGNRGAIIHCLNQVVKGMDEIEHPRAYLDAAFKIENGKHNARDHDEAAQEYKKPISKNGMEMLGNIMRGMGKGG